MNQKIKNIIGILLSIFMLFIMLYLAYYLGNSVVQSYIQYGLGEAILSFVIGIPIFAIYIYIFKKIDYIINKK